jgi:alkylated DNA repair dioxygenase AlkB
VASAAAFSSTAASSSVAGPFNACLQNFYEPGHKIGLHADDESALVHGLPIFRSFLS